MFAIELQSRLAGPPAGGKCRSVMLRLSYAAHPHPFVVKPNSPDPHAPRQLLIRYAEGERGCAGDAEAKPRSVQSAHRGIKPAAGGFCAAITIGNDPRYPLGSIRRAFPPRLPLALQGPGAAIPSRTWCLGSSNFSDMCLGRPRHRRRVAGHGPAGERLVTEAVGQETRCRREHGVPVGERSCGHPGVISGMIIAAASLRIPCAGREADMDLERGADVWSCPD